MLGITISELFQHRFPKSLVPTAGGKTPKGLSPSSRWWDGLKYSLLDSFCYSCTTWGLSKTKLVTAAWVCPAGLWQLPNCFQWRLFVQSCPHSGNPLGTMFAGFPGTLKQKKINRKCAFRSLRKQFQKHRLNVSVGDFSEAVRRFESARLPARQWDCVP